MGEYTEKEIFEIRNKAVENRIYKYEYLRYENILMELKYVRDILNTCTEEHKEMREKYLGLVERLLKEKEEIEESFRKREEIEKTKNEENGDTER